MMAGTASQPGRGLEKLASSTLLLFAFIKSELFESFSE
jgi:hypothetical protein